MKNLLFNHCLCFIFVFNFIPAPFVEASSRVTTEDVYSFKKGGDDVVYIELERRDHQPSISNPGSRRSRARFHVSIEASLQNGYLCLFCNRKIEGVEVTVLDENENVVLSSTVDILCGMDKKIDVSYFSDGTYTLLITAKKTTLYGVFEL